MNRWRSRGKRQEAPQQAAQSLYVTGDDRAVCTVYFEPWGSEYELKVGDRLQLQSSDVEEVSAANDGIVIWFRADDPMIINGAGERINV